MNAKPRIVILIACVSLLFGGLAIPTHFQPTQDVNQGEEIKSSARKHFMRGKLTSNQRIVEGLSLRNFEMVREGADGVTALVKGQHWFVLETPEYREFSKDMEKASKRLAAAADAKNIEAAALRYFDLTLNCIDCHEYLSTQDY